MRIDRQPRIGRRSDHFGIGIEQQLTLAGQTEGARQRSAGHEHGELCVLRHEAQAFLRKHGIEWHVGGTRLENANYAGEHVGVAFHAQANSFPAAYVA